MCFSFFFFHFFYFVVIPLFIRLAVHIIWLKMAWNGIRMRAVLCCLYIQYTFTIHTPQHQIEAQCPQYTYI